MFGPSNDLAGSILQVATYKHTLQADFSSHSKGIPGGLNAFDPRSIVIIGSKGSLGDDQDKVRSFELYRAQTTGVTVVTFDELFQKAERLVNLLESPVSAKDAAPQAEDPFEEDIPF